MLEKWVTDQGDFEIIRLLCQKWQIRNAIVANTGQLFFEIDCLPVKEKKILLSHQTSLPFVNLYKTSETLGKDRIAGIAGAWALFPKQASFVIDAGTCVTYDFIDKNGYYHGGNIAPGLMMRYQAMHDYTHALPLVQDNKKEKTDSDFVIPFFGQSTHEALTLGGEMGIVHEIEGYTHDLKSKFGQINIILTGGDAVFFEERLKTKIFVYPDLVLFGLEGILRFQKNVYE
jgi:type III pantothenate kinase